MWEEGVYIYGTPGVHNNFPFKYIHAYAWGYKLVFMDSDPLDFLGYSTK